MLIAWYKLNGDLLDSSGNGNHGSINGSNLTYIDGIVGKVGVFDGIKNIVLPNSEILKIKSELTISIWAKSNSVEKSNSVNSNRRDVFCMATRTYH